MRKDDLIFTLKMTALGVAATAIYVAVMLIQYGSTGDLVAGASRV